MQPKLLLLIFILFTFTISVTPDNVCKIPDDEPLGPFSRPPNYKKIVQDLIDMINRNNWTANFEKAVTVAHNTGITEMRYIESLSDYYNFLNHLVLWVPREVETGTSFYRMACTMYFVLDQDSVIDYQSPIKPGCSLPLTELSKWMVDFVNDNGKFLDTPKSLTNETLQTFYTAQNYNIDSYKVPKGGWLGHSFNEFFAREFLPGTRPIASPNNPAVIVSAADSTFGGCWNIEDDSTVVLKTIPWSIKDLLKDSEYADEFAGGKFMHAFLGTYDYHHLHAPVDGTVLEARVIPGQVYLEVGVQKHSNGKPVLTLNRKMSVSDTGAKFYGPKTPGYQFCQARGLIVIKSPIGLVAVLPVGMARVSSVVINDRIKPGPNNPNPKVKKGDEISYFQYGGSDIVLVFQKQSNVTILANIDKHYRVGEQIAIAHNIIVRSVSEGLFTVVT